MGDSCAKAKAGRVWVKGKLFTGSASPFALTSALSPEERGNPRPRIAKSDARGLAHRRTAFSLSSGERAGVRGKVTIPPLSEFPLLPAREEGTKGRMALSHSLFQASGFAGGR